MDERAHYGEASAYCNQRACKNLYVIDDNFTDSARNAWGPKPTSKIQDANSLRIFLNVCTIRVRFYEILLYILIDWEKQTALSQKQNKVTENAEHNFNYWTNFAGEKTQKLGQKSKKKSEIN